MAKTTDASGITNQATGPKIAKPCRQLAPNIPGTIASQATHTVRQDIKEASTASNEELLQVDDNDIETIERFEFENGAQACVKGNLRKHLNFWEDIGASIFILNIIQAGYRLPLEVIPKPIRLKNNKSAEVHRQFVDEALEELVTSGRVVQVAQHVRVQPIISFGPAQWQKEINT